MKENFFTSMLMEGGKISHKRWISVTVAGVLAWGIVYSLMKAANASERYSVIVATMAFILVMSGVATIAQIASIVRGGNTPAPTKTEEPKPAENG